MTSVERARAVRRVLLAILLLNWLVAAAKGLVAYFSKSLSVQADAYHSFVDGASNIVGLVAIAFASEDPDREHPYGHRKFEVLGALVIGVLLALAAYTIVSEAVERVLTGAVPRAEPVAFAVMAGTVVVNVLVAWYERRRGNLLESEVLIADSAHTRADVLASLAVIASLAFARFGMATADVVVSLGIAGLIAWAAWQVAWSGAGVLSDRAVLDAEEVKKAALAVEGVRECHEVRTRGTRDAIFADLRIHVDGGMPLAQAHELGHRVEERLKAAFPGLRDVVIHLEPDDPTHE